MKYFASLLSIIVIAACLCGSAGASKTHAPPGKTKSAAPRQAVKVAPADEYFGRLKMSILGVRNTLKDLAQKAEYNPGNPEQIFGSAAYVEEALREWEQKYPRDPWLAQSIAGLVHMYAHVPTPTGRAKMHAALTWLSARYGEMTAVLQVATAEAAAADRTAVAPVSAATMAPPIQATPLNAPAASASKAPAPPTFP